MPPPKSGAWNVVSAEGDPAALVVADPRPATGRLIRLLRPTHPAVILGSSQPESDLDEHACAEAGYTIVRRRSGGGAVSVAPGQQIWLDAFLPSDDPLYEIDVSQSALWIGELWRSALTTAFENVGEFAVHLGGVRQTPLMRRVCFLGAGPGEVFRGTRKIVGCSQRRDRHGAWFFTMAYVEVDFHLFASLFRLDGESDLDRDELAVALEQGVETLGDQARAVEQALRRRIGSDEST